MKNLQSRIITELGVSPAIDPDREIQQRTRYLSRYLAQSGLKGFVLGISGGQDSLLAGLLAQRAVHELQSSGIDASFHAALLPYGAQTDREDALLACDFMQPDSIHDINIQPIADAASVAFQKSEGHPISDFHKGNIKARTRMIAQYALAGEYELLVIGTDHAAEAITGFFTKYGDGGADILPLAGLTKRQGKALLHTLNVPEIFLKKQPTADLLDTSPSQADEHELGLSYDIIDNYLEGRIIDPTSREIIEKRFLATAHKRRLPASFSRTDVQ